MLLIFIFRSYRTAATWLHLLHLPVPVFWPGVYINVSDSPHIQLHINATGLDVLCDRYYHGYYARWLCSSSS